MNVLMFLAFEHKIKGLCFFQEKLEMLRIENMYAHGFHIQHTQHPHAYWNKRPMPSKLRGEAQPSSVSLKSDQEHE